MVIIKARSRALALSIDIYRAKALLQTKTFCFAFLRNANANATCNASGERSSIALLSGHNIIYFSIISGLPKIKAACKLSGLLLITA